MIKNLTAATAICCLTGCATKHVIPLSSISEMRVTATNITKLKINGGYISSFLQVGETRIEKTPDNILLIRAFSRAPFFHTKPSGEINVEVTIDDGVNAVAFGNPDTIIWRRNEKDQGTGANKPR
jgi:hypothetical protein